MGGPQPVTLDTLPMKRMLALEENGTEHLPPEPAQEEKPRFLLQRLDFGQSLEKDAKKAKSNKETVPPTTSLWPWQGLVEHLQQAQEELSIILDFLTHVEANEAVTVASMVKPKPLPHETCSEMALRASVKLQYFKKVGKYLKQTAKALEHQVEREAIFYGALMRLQRNWKVKRLRSISAGPGGSAGFTIDLSYPVQTEVSSWFSSRTTSLFSVNVEQDSTGLLTAHFPGRHMNALQIHFSGPSTTNGNRGIPSKDGSIVSVHEESKFIESAFDEQKAKKHSAKGIGEGVDEGARIAHSLLRRIQAAIFDEQVYDWAVKEALQPSSGVIVTGISDISLQLSLGQSSALMLELVRAHKEKGENEIEQTIANGAEKNAVARADLDPVMQFTDRSFEGKDDEKPAKQRSSENMQVHGFSIFPKEASAAVCLQEAFYQSTFMCSQIQDTSLLASKYGHMKAQDGANTISKPRESGTWSSARDSFAADTAGPLKHLSVTMRHRICSNKVLSELENLVKGVPHLCLFFHPTWHSRVTAWDLKLEIPQTVVHGWKMRLSSWSSGKRKSRSKFHCSVILRDGLVSVEGLEAVQVCEGAYKQQQQMIKYKCGISDLPGFLLYQLAGQLVTWLHEEALVMGLKVTRDLLSIYFHLSSHDDVALIASLDIKAYCINWWLHSSSAKVEDGLKEEVVAGPTQSRRFLGPLTLETLRGIVVDFLNLRGEDS